MCLVAIMLQHVCNEGTAQQGDDLGHVGAELEFKRFEWSSKSLCGTVETEGDGLCMLVGRVKHVA
jgi:hypothetical protein